MREAIRLAATIPNSSTRRRVLTAGMSGLLGMGCVDARSIVPPTERVAPHLRNTVEGPRSQASQSTVLPDPTASNRVELAGLFAYADVHSPVLLVARSTRSRAEAERTAARIRLPTNPEISVAIGPRIARTGVGLSAQVGLSQELEIAGERGLRIDAADRRIDLSDAEIERVRWMVHCDVHASFHRVLLARERAALAAKTLDFQAGVLSTVERRVEVGEAGALELRLAQAEVAQARQNQVAVEQAHYAARIELAQLSGWPVEDPPEPIGQLEDPEDPPTTEDLLAMALDQFPDLRIHQASIREAQAREKLARREVSPNPTIGVQYEREGNPAGDVTYDVVRGSVSIPIPSFQVNQGARARAQADVTVAESELRASYTLLDGRVAGARAAVVAAAERVRSYGQEILPHFEEDLALLNRSFELGEIDLLALSMGRERFLAIQNEALDAQLEYFVALAELERTVGTELRPDDHAEDSP